MTLARENDTNVLVQAVTDAGVELSGAEFGAFFYNVIDATGESYMLYTLSGAPREAFSQFPMPRNTEVFAPTFTGEAIVRSDDITRDPRYGKNAPRSGMPEGHLPVRSYLAVPVVSRSGWSLLWALNSKSIQAAVRIEVGRPSGSNLTLDARV
jgi:GAF domain-containing protein